jgi:hypothetical protein
MAFANVTTILSLREQVAKELAYKIEEAKTREEVEAILRDKVDHLVSRLERVYEDHFRLVNLMTSEQLTAYEEMQRRLGPKANREEWSQAIEEWKEAQP